MSGGNEDGGVDEGEDVGDMNEENVDEKVKRVKPYGFIRKIVLGLEEGCNWAGRREGKNKEDKDGRDNEEIFSQGCFLDERDVLRFDKEGVPLE